MATAKKDRTKKTGQIRSPLVFKATEFHQGGQKIYLFSAKASVLYEALSINRRIEDKDEGYQRTLSLGRVQAISKFVANRKTSMPSAIIVCFDKGTFKNGTLTIPARRNVGWVIDGQHRLAGCHAAALEGTNIDLAVVAFIGLTEQKQIEQFVVINRESRNVPTSLYLDLLGKLPFKQAGEAAKERAADIANTLKRDEDSVFFERIVVTNSPSDGQVSLVNFVRKISPLVTQDKGLLGAYTIREQTAVVNNYFRAFSLVYSKEFTARSSIFFKTVGFGALWNVFQNFFSQTLGRSGGFQVKDAVSVLQKVSDFDFGAWRGYGTGNQAELVAAEDFRAALLFAYQSEEGKHGTLKV